MENIIVLKQEPIISYNKIEEVGQEVQKRISDLNIENLIATEDTIQAVKGTRTDLNKEFSAFEEQRKLIKKAVEAPYKEFEDKYKKFIATHYNNADSVLKDKISRFENDLKQDKENRIKAYFQELTQSKEIDFVPFSKLGLNITLSASEKSLRASIDTFIAGIEKDLNTLKSIPKDDDFKMDTLFEYKKSLDMSQALRITQEREKAKEEAQKKAEQEREKAEAKQQETASPQPEILQAPRVETTKEEELFTTSFRLKGTKEQLVALKQFIINNNIQILD